MNVLLYTENEKMNRKSGLGKAIQHQMKALELNDISYTRNINDDYDILHINTYFLKSYYLAKKARKNNKKVVYHAHSTEEDYRNGFILSKQTSKLFKKWLIKCYSLGDVIVTPSEYSKKLLEGYGMNKKIYAISNGVELDFFKENKKLKSEFREKFNYSDNDKIIMAMGLYIERKGIVDFVELAKRLSDYKFIWFGESPLALGGAKVVNAVNTKLPNLNFAGYVEKEDIMLALNGCDLFIFPTLEETEGIPIIEALSCKTPTIIRDIPVFDWLTDKVNVYKAKDIDDFEKKINLFFNDKLPDITNEGKKIVNTRSINYVGKQLKQVYEEVMKL